MPLRAHTVVTPRSYNLDFGLRDLSRLTGKAERVSGSLSGGEQQMPAMARALMSAPRIPLIDQPSVGLAPVLVKRTIEEIKELD